MAAMLFSVDAICGRGDCCADESPALIEKNWSAKHIAPKIRRGMARNLLRWNFDASPEFRVVGLDTLRCGTRWKYRLFDSRRDRPDRLSVDLAGQPALTRDEIRIGVRDGVGRGAPKPWDSVAVAAKQDFDPSA